MKSELASGVDRLLATQPATWALLARGVQGLRESQTRHVMVGGRELLVRHIPHRITSTTAAVDAASVSRRPCFLCSANLPPEEIGIPFDSTFTIYCNPFPILDGHLTIVHAEHRPQRIAGFLEGMLNLAEALPEYFLIYNGPECGASAPDHLHFQACSRAVFPIERDVREVAGLFIPNYGRQVLVFRDRNPHRLVKRLDRVVEILGTVSGLGSGSRATPVEPMLNIAAYWHDGQWTVLVFPRSKHRPRVFEAGELTVSPAAIDLCGVFVVPVQKDFERITGTDIESIFEEVTLQEEAFAAVLALLEKE